MSIREEQQLSRILEDVDTHINFRLGVSSLFGDHVISIAKSVPVSDLRMEAIRRKLQKGGYQEALPAPSLPIRRF